MKAFRICSIAFIFTISSFSQWVPLTTNTTAGLQDICFIDANTGIAAGNNGVLIRTTNAGANWTQISCPTSQVIYSLCFPSILTGYASGYTGYIIKSLNSGLTWNNATSCGINVRSISFINTLTGITGGGGSLMCYTTDGGTSWNPRYTPTPHAVSGLHYFNASLLMVCATDMPGAVLHKSTDGGNNWSTVLTQNNSGLNITYSLSSVYCKDENTIFATGSNSTFGQNWGRIYRSANAGNNWETVGSIGPDAGQNITCVYFGDNQSGFAAGNSGVIMRSTNSGANWEAQTSGTTTSLTAVYMLNALTGYICGGNGLILKTTNGGVTGLVPISTEIPKQFMLEQNYPNPFNPTTKIKFQIPPVGNARDRSVQVTLYDIMGREIAELVNQQLQPGTYEVEWNGSNYSSGLYFYRLFAGDPLLRSGQGFIETKKMILIK